MIDNKDVDFSEAVRDVDVVLELVDGGRLKIHVEHAIPFEEVVRAHALLESGLKGKAVLTL